MGVTNCPWCRDYNDPANDNCSPALLCEGHLAEYEGLTITELRRSLAEQLADQI